MPTKRPLGKRTPRGSSPDLSPGAATLRGSSSHRGPSEPSIAFPGLDVQSSSDQTFGRKLLQAHRAAEAQRRPCTQGNRVKNFSMRRGDLLPPCGGGREGGRAKFLSLDLHPRQIARSAQPPTLSRPHKGGGDADCMSRKPLHSIALTAHANEQRNLGKLEEHKWRTPPHRVGKDRRGSTPCPLPTGLTGRQAKDSHH